MLLSFSKSNSATCPSPHSPPNGRRRKLLSQAFETYEEMGFASSLLTDSFEMADGDWLVCGLVVMMTGASAALQDTSVRAFPH